MAATLQDIVNQLKNNKESSDLTSKNVDETTSAVKKLTESIDKSFTMFFQQKKIERLNLDPLEAEREKNKSKFTKNFEAGQKEGQTSLGGLGDMLDIAKMIWPALAALPLAIAGMRGWEIPVISRLTTGLIKGFGKLADSFKVKFSSGVDDIMRSVLKSFGINPATGKMLRDARGRFTGREMKTTTAMISEAFDLLRSNVTKAFGVGDDGGKIGRIVSKAGKLMYTIVSPFISIGKAVGGWMTGSGAKMLGFLDSVMGISGGVANIGKFARFVGKILKPIGFLFSAYDGVMAFMNTEGTFMDKFVAGIGAFIGDFIGAPLDLLKSIVAWSLEQLGFENAAKWLESWSFETIINDAIGGIWNMIKSAVDWVKLLFTDPGQALSDLFWGYIGLYESIGEWIYSIAVKPLWTWFENTFPDLSTGIKDLWNTALGGAADLGSWIWDNSLGPLIDWIKDQFGGVAEYFGLGADLGLPERPQSSGGSTNANPPMGHEGENGHWQATDRIGGKKWVPDEPALTTVPKATGQKLQEEQNTLTSQQRQALSGGVVANSGNVTNNNNRGGDTVINYGNGAAPSPYDQRRGARANYLATQ